MTTGPLSGLAIAVLAFAAATFIRHQHVEDRYLERVTGAVPQDVLMSPGEDALRLASLEHRQAAAELWWLSIVQELGQRTGQRFDRIEQWTYITTDLDPFYSTAYHAPAVTFTVLEKNFDRSDRVLAVAMKRLPGEWRFPFLAGYNAYFGHANPEIAAELWLEASRQHRAPNFLVSLAARARFHAGDERAAEKMLVEMLPHLDEQQRVEAEIRLKGIRSEYRFRKYDAACAKVQEVEGRVPTAKELWEKGYVPEPPVDYADGPIEIHEDCRARSKIFHTREDEAKKRIGSQKRGARSRDEATP